MASISKSSLDRIMVPEYLPLFNAAEGNCQGQQETQMLAELLTRYNSVFSTLDSDIEKTTLIVPSIPLMEEV